MDISVIREQDLMAVRIVSVGTSLAFALNGLMREGEIFLNKASVPPFFKQKRREEADC